VVDPPAPVAVDQPPYPGGDKAMTERARFLVATSTAIIEPEVRPMKAEAQTASTDPPKPQKPGVDY
jgi:hypothetical protein